MRGISIYYDGNCPFCSHYVRLLRLREACGPVHLVNLRESLTDRQRFQQAGLDVDRGMVVEMDDRLYCGGEAINVLAMLSSGQGLFNTFNRMVFGHRWLSVVVYPLLRFFRNALLLLLNRKSLTERDPNHGYTVFCVGWGVFACLHFIVYATQYRAPLYWSTWLILPLGYLLVLFPGDRRIFVGLVLAQLIDAVLQMPVFSNHTMIKNFFILAVGLGGLGYALRGYSWQRFFAAVAPVGRSLLIIMYIFGVWHKINSDFLNPEVSCAAALWATMPVFLSVFDYVPVLYLGIYGTLFIETLIIVLLLAPRFRWLGIVLGIFFHALLALSGYAFYAPFSALTISLHLLYLSPRSAAVITRSAEWRSLVEGRVVYKKALLVALVIGVVWFLAYHGLYTAAAVIWLVSMGGLFVAVFKYARFDGRGSARAMVQSPSMVLNVVTVLFFLNCMAPYLGLKTAQSGNMFANLRLEGGVSNHLILSSPPGPFRYLEDVVEIVDSSSSRKLTSVRAGGYQMVYYDLLATLADNPSAKVSFIRDGVLYRDQTAGTLGEDISNILHPAWFRKWFHFTMVDSRVPKPCGLST